MKLLRCISLLLYLLIGSIAFATNQYYVSSTGSDSNNGTSPGTPWATIAHADATLAVGTSGTCTPTGTGWPAGFSVPNAGACVHVNGSFSASISTTKSGNDTTTRVVFISDTYHGATFTCPTWQVGGSFSEVDGFNMTGPATGCYAFNVSPGSVAHHINIQYNYLHDWSTSGCAQVGIINGGFHDDIYNSNIIRHAGSYSADANNCVTLHGIYSSGAATTGNGQRDIYENNIISGITGYGIKKQCVQIPFIDGCSGAIVNNTIFNNGGGVLLTQCSSPCGVIDYTTITNNIIVNNGVDVPAGNGRGGLNYYHVSGTHIFTSNNVIYGNLPADLLHHGPGAGTICGTSASGATPVSGTPISGSDADGNAGGCPANSSQTDSPSNDPTKTFISFQVDDSSSPASNYNPLNYKLQSPSHAVGTGTTSCAVSPGLNPCAPSVDFLNVTRTNAPSIGAFEFNSGGGGGTLIISVTPNPEAFPDTVVGSTSNQLFTLTNVGTGNITITAPFTVSPTTNFATGGAGGTCAVNLTVTPGSTCTSSAHFSPTTTGNLTANYNFFTNATAGTYVVPLSGNGLPAPSSIITVGSASITFAGQPINSTSSIIPDLITNTGNANLIISSVALDDNSNWVQSNNCTGQSIPPGGTCTVNPAFTPKTTGVKTGHLTLTANTSPTTTTITLTGTPTQSAIAAAPVSLTFTDTNIGSSTAPKTVTITNNGTGLANLTISTSGPYSQTNTCANGFSDSFTSGTLDASLWVKDTGTAPGNFPGLNNSTFSTANAALVGASVVNAASCSQTDVTAAIASASAGQIVLVPAGTCTYTTSVANTPTININKAITVQGQTSCTGRADTLSCVDNTIILDGTGTGFQEDPFYISVSNARLNGITIKDTRGSVDSEGYVLTAPGTTGWRVDHMHILSNVGGTGTGRGVEAHGFGLIDHNYLQNVGTAFPVFGSQAADAHYPGDTSWTQAMTFGTVNAVYIEDNELNYTAAILNGQDNYAGARSVFRYNDVKGSNIGSHGLDTGGFRSVLQHEVYNNTFTNAGSPISQWFVSRGGSFLIFNNVISGTGGSYNTFLDLRNYRSDCNAGTCGSWGNCDGTSAGAAGTAGDQNTGGQQGYVCRDQVGRGNESSSAGDWPLTATGYTFSETSFPGYSWNNTFKGAAPSISNVHVGGFLSDTRAQTFHILNNRDFYVEVAGFNGTTGTGSGVFTSRPATCTTGVGYWATDTNVFYQCTSTNTWGTYYTPFTYPHPLQSTFPQVSALGLEVTQTAGTSTVNSNLDDFPDVGGSPPAPAGNWQWQHDSGTPGSASATSSLVASPSLDGQSRQFNMTFSGGGGVRTSLYYNSSALDSTSTAFVYDIEVYLSSLTHINQIEMDINQDIVGGNTVIFGHQCNFVAGFWDYTINATSTTSQWVHSGIPCSKGLWLTGSTPNHVVIRSHRNGGIVTYDSVTLNGTTSQFNASGSSSFAIGFTPVGLQQINFQINGDNTSSTLTVNLDSFSVTASTAVTSVGAEVRSLQTYGFGTYDWLMRSASTATTPSGTGSVASGQISSDFDFINNSQTELDVPEIEGQFPNQAEFTTWESTSLSQESSVAITAPDQAAHHYKVVWAPISATYFIDNVQVASHANNVPQTPANIMMNIWGTNYLGFGGLATTGVNRWMYINNFSYVPATASIPVGGTCTIGVVFTPLAVGGQPGTLTVAVPDGGANQVIPLSGNGLNPTNGAKGTGGFTVTGGVKVLN